VDQIEVDVTRFTEIISVGDREYRPEYYQAMKSVLGQYVAIAPSIYVDFRCAVFGNHWANKPYIPPWANSADVYTNTYAMRGYAATILEALGNLVERIQALRVEKMNSNFSNI
jgi:hypothetical protein